MCWLVGTIEDVDDMCKEDDVGKTTSASGVGSSRSEGSSVPPWNMFETFFYYVWKHNENNLVPLFW